MVQSAIRNSMCKSHEEGQNMEYLFKKQKEVNVAEVLERGREGVI